jgi:dimethylaniline monooxygenase (N-oxide forming)
METKVNERTLAVIGGGISGICSAKFAKANGYNVTIFEKADYMTGMWSGVHMYDSLILNCCKYTCEFSDYRWPEDVGLFPTHREMYKYLTGYINEFELGDLFQFNAEVVGLENADVHWTVTWKDLKNGDVKISKFDYVVVATGYYARPKYLNFRELTTGNTDIKLLHSSEYKNHKEFIGKRVIVIGSSSSAQQIANELCEHAKVYNVFRKPSFCLPRFYKSEYFNTDIPYIAIMFSRLLKPTNNGTRVLTQSDRNKMRNQYLATVTGQNDVGGALTMDPESDAAYSISWSESYLDCFKKGLIEGIVSQVKSVNGKCVTLENGDTIECDAIILGTGFGCDLGFLSQDIKDKLEYEENDELSPLVLYNNIFHPATEGLAFVGTFKGLFFGMAELSARYVVQHFLKQITVDPKVIDKYLNMVREIRISSVKALINGSYANYCDRLAKEMGIPTTFEDIKESDITLYNDLTKGPILMCHYNLYNKDGEINPEIADYIKFINNKYRLL